MGLWGSFYSFMMITPVETEKNEEFIDNTSSTIKYKSLSLEDEVLKEVEKSGKSGILQIELLEKYYTNSPSKSTLYQAIKNLEAETKIIKIKEGRTYRIFTC